MVRGFSRFVLFLFLGLLRAPMRNSPERVRDTIWTFPEKSAKHPGLETPRFSFSPSLYLYLCLNLNPNLYISLYIHIHIHMCMYIYIYMLWSYYLVQVWGFLEVIIWSKLGFWKLLSGPSLCFFAYKNSGFKRFVLHTQLSFCVFFLSPIFWQFF